MKWDRGLLYYFKQIKVDEFDENYVSSVLYFSLKNLIEDHAL